VVRRAAVEAIMTGCQFQSKIAAYHDGELDEAASKEVELHLSGCKECTEELRALREVTAAMADFDPGEITPMELARLHRKIEKADEGSLVRFNVALIGMAASVLIICLAWIGQGPSSGPQGMHGRGSVSEWERLALGGTPRAPWVQDGSGLRLPDTGVAKGPDSDTIDWMLNGLQPPISHESR
jgi:anti-sigma factor RsiW